MVFPFVALSPVDREVRCLVAECVESSSEAAACIDFGELVVVADEDDFGSDFAGVVANVPEVECAGHCGFVDHDHVTRRQCVETGVSESWNGVGVDSGTVAEFACGLR